MSCRRFYRKLSTMVVKPLPPSLKRRRMNRSIQTPRTHTALSENRADNTTKPSKTALETNFYTFRKDSMRIEPKNRNWREQTFQLAPVKTLICRPFFSFCHRSGTPPVDSYFGLTSSVLISNGRKYSRTPFSESSTACSSSSSRFVSTTEATGTPDLRFVQAPVRPAS